VVTQFGVEPGFIERQDRDGNVHRFKVGVSKILSLTNDLALALAAESIRIEAPVPGRSVVGIEVPNSAKAMVGLRGVVESNQFRKVRSRLAIAMGRDVSGDAYVADLSAMPHLLIAGATGSGKSVCLNAAIVSLIYQNTADQLKLLLIDPKRVELTRYNASRTSSPRWWWTWKRSSWPCAG
jgi:S-DNA-T family DNA segregation ATPase FtsK/SpoIIIE